MMKIRRGHPGLLVAIALVIAGCVASPGAAPVTPVGTVGTMPSPTAATATVEPAPSLAPLSADEAWAMLIPGDPASVSYASLAAIARDSDVVVVGSPGAFVKGPDFTDEYGNLVSLASLTLNVERVLRGTVMTTQPGTLTIRTWLGVDPGGYDYAAEFARLAASRPSGRAVFFLANLAALNKRMGGPPGHPTADPYAYEILGGQGFLRDVAGLVEPPAVPDEALAGMAGTWQRTLRGRPFDEVVTEVAAIP